MGYVFRNEDARNYNEWFMSEPGHSAWTIETELLQRIWAPASPQKVLEVGCGTGIFLDWFARQGHQVTGIEPSPPMLNIARLRLPHCISVDQGYAEDLPYDDNSFDTVAIVTTLEFVNDPAEALREAFRVARRHVLIGALNKLSIISCQRFLARLWKSSVYDHAHFFSVFELQSLATKALSLSVKVRWGTCLALPLFALPYSRFLERSRYFNWHPFGHFIAMRLDIEHTLRTLQDPLFAKIPPHLVQARPQAPCCFSRGWETACPRRTDFHLDDVWLRTQRMPFSFPCTPRR